MRAYVFCHHYLKPMLQSLQAGHAIAEWGLLRPNSKDHRVHRQWLRDHKTIILLDGGFTGRLTEYSMALQVLSARWKKSTTAQALSPSLPYTDFYEDEETLGGILTATGVIVPEDVYGMSDESIQYVQEIVDSSGMDVISFILSMKVSAAPVAHLMALLLRSARLAS